MRRTLALMAITAGMVLGGCGAGPSPRAEVGPARVVAQTPEGVRVEVPVTLVNPDPTPLPIRETRFTLDVDAPGAEPFRFTERAAATMPGEGAQTIVLPAAFAIRGDAVGRPYRLTGTVIYQPPGEIRQLLTDSGVPLPSVGFSAAGRLAPPAEARE